MSMKSLHDKFSQGYLIEDDEQIFTTLHGFYNPRYNPSCILIADFSINIINMQGMQGMQGCLTGGKKNNKKKRSFFVIE